MNEQLLRLLNKRSQTNFKFRLNFDRGEVYAVTNFISFFQLDGLMMFCKENNLCLTIGLMADKDQGSDGMLNIFIR